MKALLDALHPYQAAFVIGGTVGGFLSGSVWILLYMYYSPKMKYLWGAFLHIIAGVGFMMMGVNFLPIWLVIVVLIVLIMVAQQTIEGVTLIYLLLLMSLIAYFWPDKDYN